MKLKMWLPLILFILIAAILWWGLTKDPHKIASPLINKTLPSFSADSLMPGTAKITQADFIHHISLLNVFGTWCLVCREENLVLMDIAHTHRLQLMGLDYRDKRSETLAWLDQYGNPYQKIIVDPQGSVAIELGVYGTPETFLIDKKGMIRYKHIGVLTEEIWLKELLPLVQQVEQE